MADYFYDNIKPNYTFGTKNIKIDPDNNQITISDTSINKILNINSQQLSNNSGQSLLFSDIYLTVNKTPSITYPPTNSNTLNINNSIVLTNGTTTNTLNQSDWTGTIKTLLSTQNLTHYINMSDASGTGQGNPQKSSLITANPLSGNISASSFTGTASNATAINLTSDNTNGTYFIPFSKTANGSNNLFVDNVTGPLTYNPSTSTLSTTVLNSDVLLPITQNIATFTGTTLSVNGSSLSFKNSSITFTGGTNTIQNLTLTNMPVGGRAYVGILNNGSGNLTVNTGLGTNIKTTNSSNINVPPARFAIMEIRTITFSTGNINMVTTTVLTN